MKDKIKALIWEECRVAGSITLACTVMGILVLASFKLSFEGFRLEHDGLGGILIICGAPLLTLFLLIFNPDYKGALHGGFSERILHLPIPTFIPVLVSLVTRTLFILLATTFIFATTRFLYDNTLSYQFIYGITLLYIVVQFLDWARVTLSGLVTTLNLLAITLFAWLYLADGKDTVQQTLQPILQMQSSHILYLAAIITTLGLACYLATFLVHQTRIGKTHGFPEFWHWRLSFDRTAIRDARPFNTPLQAQIWLNLRQSRFILPIVTFLSTIAFAAALMVFALVFPDTNRNSYSGGLTGTDRAQWSLIPFAALLLGALAQGAVTGIIGYRDTKGLPGYTYLQPLSTEQYAHARMIANAILLLPTVLVVAILHFAIGGHTFVTETIPEALDLGLTSPKEITWILLSRALTATLVAWTLLSATRLYGVIIAVAGCTFFLTDFVYGYVNFFFRIADEDEIFTVALSILVILICLAAYFRAAKARLVQPKTILLWFAPWVLATWVLLGQVDLTTTYSVMSQHIDAVNQQWAQSDRDPAFITFMETKSKTSFYTTALLTILGIGALIPLPFIGTLLDIRKKRHSAAPRQSTLPIPKPIHLKNMIPTQKTLLTICIIAIPFALWLGWPARPAYETVWRDNGFPVTPQELNDSYAAVPDDENAAPMFLAVHDHKVERSADFVEMRANRIRKENESVVDPYLEVWDDILVVEGRSIEPGTPVPESILRSTEEYWTNVTNHVVPQLKAITARGEMKSRYPIDFRAGDSIDTSYQWDLRELATELELDAVYRTLKGETTQAVESILAIRTIADSLKDIPTSWSKFSRFGILDTARSAIQTVLNIAEFSEQDLKALQEELEEHNELLMDIDYFQQILVGESIANLSMIHSMSSGGGTLVLKELLLPTVAETLALSLAYEDVRRSGPRDPWKELTYSYEIGTSDEEMFIAPMATMFDPSWQLRNFSTAGYVLYNNLSIAAIAIERYRVEHGAFPDSLEALIPTYLDAIPIDLYSRDSQPLRYSILDISVIGNRLANVYSIGRDGIADHESSAVIERKRDQDDIRISVAKIKINELPPTQ